MCVAVGLMLLEKAVDTLDLFRGLLVMFLEGATQFRIGRGLGKALMRLSQLALHAIELLQFGEIQILKTCDPHRDLSSDLTVTGWCALFVEIQRRDCASVP